ncbi:MAG: hypothetical protein KJ558_00375 [Gammaproteobacteria bacterium]|nr:hypothetical protein [Gammaproteobacteria bacterium]MBU1653298.1 hypothetical protein [Gammaproteobacteria bacterium]MBU1962438.1 hypothetical protein [Gammaproteobacteria bacterium]
MQRPDDQSLDMSVLLTLLMIFIFASPFTRWWSGAGLPWFLPYLLWLLPILLGAWTSRKGGGA